MATVREIERLLKKVNITIDELDISMTIKMERKLKDAQNIEQYLLKNASEIDFKKLLVITVKRLQELRDTYKNQKISPLLEKNAQEQLEKAIEFAKSYIKPNEIIKLYARDYQNEEKSIKLLNSSEIIYGKKIKRENKKYDEIKNLMPDINIYEAKEMLEEILEDKNTAIGLYTILADNTIIKQGYSEKELAEMAKESYNSDEIIPKSTLELIDEELFNAFLRGEFEEIKAFINTDKYILFHTNRLNEKLENKEELNEDEEIFLENISELLKDIKKNTRIKIGDTSSYGKKEAERFISKWNKEEGKYYTEEEIKTGKVLIKDMNGYESYLNKDELRELAKIEENLIYLAQKKMLSRGNILSIIRNSEISQNTIAELYCLECITLKQIEEISKEKQYDFETLKEQIKQIEFNNPKDIDITDQETWELLNQSEKLNIIVEKIDSGDTEVLKKLGEEKIKQLYSVSKVADLYREIYINQNIENREKYEKLIKMYNALEKENSDSIINELEDELSNEMLINLYSDSLISVEVLESYGEKELVIEAFEQGKILEKDINKVINEYPINLNEDKVIELYQKGIISEKDIVDLYVDDKTKLEAIKKLNEILPDDKKIREFLSEEELVNLYQKGKENQEDLKKYKRYKLLYQAVKREKLDEEEKSKLDNKLIGDKEFEEEDVLKLYKDNLLTLDTVLKYGGKEAVRELVKCGDLKPSDAKFYFDLEKEEAIDIREILKDPNVEDIQKIMLIYSTYDDDKEKRDELVNYLQAHATDIKGEPIGERNLRDKKNHEGNKTVTDPYERWRYFAALDRNYTKEYIDGYLIIGLNNTQRTLVEKMYEKKNGKIFDAYGVATFSMPTEEYLEIENDIKKGDRLNISKLRRAAKENPDVIEKITHHPPTYDKEGNEKNSYGKRVLESVCNGRIDEVYTEEQLEEINECMRNIELSRQELNR